jgi:hypothetical protein
MPDDLVVIYRARVSHHAHLLRNLLADYGVQASVTGDALLNAGGEFVHSGGIPVIVNEADVELARQIANSFDRHVVQAESVDEFDDDLSPPWLDWPICPQCKARQTAVCCHCGERRDDFALAEWQGNHSESPTDVLLVCGTCDDVFVPQFYRDCPWCGFHFGTGIDPQISGGKLDLRDLRLFWGAVLGAAATIGYLWLLYW